MDTVEYLESTTVRLDWTIRGLKQLFESSKGEAKSKVTKSVKFGGGRWQILFYPNSGTEGGQFVSLYLSCEPTAEEKESALNGNERWVRCGFYKFSFELHNLSRYVLFNKKEANDHAFSWKTANWGWAQFARRESVYYVPTTVRQDDAFLITCTISSSPTAPSVLPSIPHRLVPKDLLDAVGALLDDPTYSDVEFILPRRGSSSQHGARRIFAARTILKRADYFDSMFSSGFVESSSQSIDLSASQINSPITSAVSETDTTIGSRHFEDSDDEDEEELTNNDSDAYIRDNEGDEEGPEETRPASPQFHNQEKGNGEYPISLVGSSVARSSDLPGIAAVVVDANMPDQGGNNSVSERSVRAKPSHPSSPRQTDRDIDVDQRTNGHDENHKDEVKPAAHGPRKIRVIVSDVAYATYRAVLYYLYTNTITFAPLASSFLTPSSPSPPSVSSPGTLFKSPGEGQNLNPSMGSGLRATTKGEPSNCSPTTRRAWIRDWEHHNPGKIRPCSAKAVYRIADKLDLGELKTRAFQHITNSLSIHNVPYEMFSTFSATFEEVRKPQITFFLDNWNEIRSSDSMRSVWQQIRVGRHPGFEEVWPLIAANLEFKPRSTDVASDDNREVANEA